MLNEYVPLKVQFEREADKYKRESGYVYLIHFDTPYRHAQHYIGWAEDLCRRLEQHRKGQGSRLMGVIGQKGITWRVARVWKGASRNWERKLKNLKKAGYYCPICNPRMREFLFDERECFKKSEGFGYKLLWRFGLVNL